jgi:hypothetical protein
MLTANFVYTDVSPFRRYDTKDVEDVPLLARIPEILGHPEWACRAHRHFGAAPNSRVRQLCGCISLSWV